MGNSRLVTMLTNPTNSSLEGSDNSQADKDGSGRMGMGMCPQQSGAETQSRGSGNSNQTGSGSFCRGSAQQQEQLPPDMPGAWGMGGPWGGGDALVFPPGRQGDLGPGQMGRPRPGEYPELGLAEMQIKMEHMQEKMNLLAGRMENVRNIQKERDIQRELNMRACFNGPLDGMNMEGWPDPMMVAPPGWNQGYPGQVHTDPHFVFRVLKF